MRVLADTSIWIDHFRNGNSEFAQMLEQDLVFKHPFVIGELACGTPPLRTVWMQKISVLKSAKVATLDDVVALIDGEKLYGRGCGYVDLSLLCSTLITPGARLWTIDKRLLALAKRFGVAYGELH